MKRLMLCMVTLIVVSGCGMAHRSEENTYAETETVVTHDVAPAQVPRQPDAGLRFEAKLEPTAMRIERSGSIRVDTKNEMAASTKLRRLAGDFDAAVMSFNDHSVTFKLPSDRLVSLLGAIENTAGWEIDEFDFSAWDRTGEFYSVEARVESANAVKERLMKLLEAAATLDDVLKIHNKLEDIQQKLDGFETSLHDIKLRAGRVDVTILFD